MSDLIKQHKRAYSCWRSMLYRCKAKNRPSSKYYVDRGISVCKRWEQFDNFFADMGDPPDGKSLDRFPDRNGNYEPSNCRWATQAEQIVNQDRTRMIEFGGKRMPLRYAANAAGIDERTVHGRIRRGWSVEDAIRTPINPKFRNGRC